MNAILLGFGLCNRLPKLLFFVGDDFRLEMFHLLPGGLELGQHHGDFLSMRIAERGESLLRRLRVCGGLLAPRLSRAQFHVG